jgi:pimeloyl-ACP methyl ester carboxylesterase
MLEVNHVDAGDLRVRVATSGPGDGPPILLLHGWPHTWEVWSDVIPLLAASGHRVVAPDLRGIGGTAQPDGGYDLHTLAGDAAAVLDAVGITAPAAIAGIDLGAPIAWMAGARLPERFDRVIVMESLLGRLPGGEAFLASGPPWWFGFHAVPGLAETVLEGHEREYVEFFLPDHLPPTVREAFVEAYTGRLHGGFLHYRALANNAKLIATAAAGSRAAVPTLAVAGGVVGDALARQLAPITPALKTATIPDCGHIIPLEQPHALANALFSFLSAA